MKPEELAKFDDLVVQRITEILKLRHNIEVQKSRKDVLRAASRIDSSEVNELLFALRRIEKGIYGQCVICRHDISPDVLKDHLTARFCFSCEVVIHEKTAR
ncbi:MAG: hypothetical protein M1339_04695 [Bacteroidetes bacterium]|nr:hypothetical protein [Bacteroidota bacterium]